MVGMMLRGEGVFCGNISRLGYITMIYLGNSRMISFSSNQHCHFKWMWGPYHLFIHGDLTMQLPPHYSDYFSKLKSSL